MADRVVEVMWMEWFRRRSAVLVLDVVVEKLICGGDGDVLG